MALSLKMEKMGKNWMKRDQDVPFHAWGYRWDAFLPLGRSSGALGGSQGAADGTGLPLGLGMAPAPTV